MRQIVAYQHRQLPEERDSCDDLLQSPDPGRLARRPLLRAAVLGQANALALHSDAYASLLRPRPVARRLVLTGTLEAVRPDALVLRTREGEEQLATTQSTAAWRGAAVPPSGLRPGDQVIVRKCAPWRAAVDQVWAAIGRATGTILATRPNGTGSPRRLELIVDEGPGKPPKIVIIAREAYRQILVRFPRLEPGYLIDVIGLRHSDFLEAVTPATAQPAYRADHPPAPPLVAGQVANPVNGTAVWHEPGAEPAGVLGLAYPAVDPDSGCGHGQRGQRGDPHGSGTGCVRLPYLSVGSVVTMRNECSGLSMPLPVTSCGASARLFCDRCVECRTSLRGRVADLTMTAFVELGGRLENGCFNASLKVTGLAAVSVRSFVIMSFGGAVLSAAREVQIPILATLLIGACAAKVRRAVSAHCLDAAGGPTAMFPIQLRKPVTIAMCACEGALGIGLLATAGQAGAELAATATRSGAVLLLATAAGALNELRHRRPDVGCGCFGDLSEAPVSWRTLTRSVLLCAAAIATIGVPPLQMPATPAAAVTALAIGAAELLVIAALSPEVGQLLIRLGYSDPCEARRVPVARSLACLRGSGTWRAYQKYLTSPGPTDVWREGCWRFLAFAAVINYRTVDVVFGVYLQAHRPAVRAAVVAPLDVNPAGIALPVTMSSDAEILSGSVAMTAPMPVPDWAPRITPTFTPAMAAQRAPRPDRVHVRPLAHAAPRESAHLRETAPQPAILQSPRLAHHHPRRLRRSPSH